ncbi:POT family proton-dependent oligopeptide transporter [Sphingosinicella microcystinivorans]|uniref:POT family proton-dependent oligopeptide transporter n=1 Tax=Sphingosinicella microcystinivorans TaxID=335406 RepID=A0ABX9T1X8_SPHMI|nr:POT family proton-dependent oligopeptide transporter [Sphingosinicella microcystinivorans]
MGVRQNISSRSRETLKLARSGGPAGFFGHPRALGYIAVTEAWERFAQYGMQALLVLYLVDTLLQPGHIESVAGFAVMRAILEALFGPMQTTALASAIFGIYGSFIYLTPILGGFLADRLLGRSATVIAGSVLMISGHFLMMSEAAFLPALLLLVFGIGCFKGNLAAQINALYGMDDARRADAYQIYTLAVNAGVIAAPLVAGTLGETLGWRYGFAAAGVGMGIGLGVYLAGRRYLPENPAPKAKMRPAGRWSLSASEWKSTLALLALLPVLALAAIGNQQMFNAYLIWSDASASLDVFGTRMPTTWLITIDMLASIACLLGVMWFWRRMAVIGIAPMEITRIAIGCLFSVAAYVLLASATWMADSEGAKVGLATLVVFHILGSTAFAHIYPVSLALYARASPPAIVSTMMGIYYLHLFLANGTTGWIGGWLDRLDAYVFWLMHAGLGLLACIMVLAIGAVCRRTLSAEAPASTHQDRPTRQG